MIGVIEFAVRLEKTAEHWGEVVFGAVGEVGKVLGKVLMDTSLEWRNSISRWGEAESV